MKLLKTSLTFALSVGGFIWLNQAYASGCYCQQGHLQGGGQCVAPVGPNNSIVAIGYAICPSGQPQRRQYDTPPPKVTTDQCQARPQGGKACLTIYKQDPDYKFHLMETNAQGNLIYARFYHVDGQTIKSEQWYNAQGIKHGAFKSYHSNGTQKSLGNFVNGQLQGDYKIHDENGQLIKIEHYKNDNSVLEVHYQNGKKHGQETEFDYVQTKKGLTPVVVRTTVYQHGKKHGEEKFFEADKKGRAKLIKTVIWQHGNQVR